MSDLDPTPVTPPPAKSIQVALPRLTFYFSASHRKTYAPGRSISKFKGQEFTQCCAVGEQPTPGPDVQTLGTGTQDDVTTSAPA